MGTQQLLLAILGVFIVGIAIAVGLGLFSSQSVQTKKDAMINDLNHLATQAYQYRSRPASLGGGQGSYTGYALLPQMASNENATYTISTTTPTAVTLVGTSIESSTNTIAAIVDTDGKLGGWTYTGDFQ